MRGEKTLKVEHQTSMRHWERTAPWFRRFSMRVGIEGKLILCVIAVLLVSMAVTSFAFVQQAHDRLADIMGEQARQVATSLSLTSESLYHANDFNELHRRGQELIKSRNILFVGFLDSNGTPRALASRDLDFRLNNLSINLQSLMQVTPCKSPTFGEYLEVVSPILSIPQPSADAPAHTGSRLLGYVAVGVSQMREEAQMSSVYYTVIGLGCLLTIAAVPVAYLLVHRIFLPIRKLVTITRKITAGDLTARVEIHRPDVIGELARSFDEMVMRVKKQQEDLADANHDLERKVEQRTAQLETANSRLSSEIAEKDEFLRAVSHDLNAPLRNIAGMVMMLLSRFRGGFDSEILHRLERIKSNVDVETNLIGELLELSRIKSRRLKIETVELSGMIADLREMFDSDLRQHGIELLIDPPGLPVLRAERARIRQVFQNLIDNAIKYMGTGPLRQIHIGCEVHADEFEFYVRDTGIGIDADDIDRVFQIFRRGRNTAGTSISGKGVGLASVKSIVETYNGRIWVTSRPGEGSTFRFTISNQPVKQTPDRAAA